MSMNELNFDKLHGVNLKFIFDPKLKIFLINFKINYSLKIKN